MYTFYAKEPHWWYIVWNDILAVIPLFAAMLCEHYYSKKKAVPAVIFGFLWLLFFPNSPYMMTDLKYTSYFKESAYLEYEKNRNECDRLAYCAELDGYGYTRAAVRNDVNANNS